jgi:hypothetical protein
VPSQSRLAASWDASTRLWPRASSQRASIGSGNFLTESYQCLRRLENRILIELSKDGQISFDIEGTGEDQVKVSLANFHGIEINDFACAVARTALWIAEKQADADTASIVHRVYQALPLTDYRWVLPRGRQLQAAL